MLSECKQMFVFCGCVHSFARRYNIRRCGCGYAPDSKAHAVRPKRELIHAGVVALQEGRLKFGANVPERAQLMEELLAYRVKINLQTGHDSYAPWREGRRDDLLFALCLATWAWGYTKRSYEEHAIAPPRTAH